MPDTESNIIIYNTIDGKASVALYAKDGKIWLNQMQMAELFATSIANINMHISNILKEKELNKKSVIKDYLITAMYRTQNNIQLTNNFSIQSHYKTINHINLHLQ